MTAPANIANARLARLISCISACPKLPEICAMAQRLAHKSYMGGERYHAGNNTAYPAKHYRYIESVLGVLSAPQFVAFNSAYAAHLGWVGETEQD